MRIGKLDRRILIERPVVLQNEFGERAAPGDVVNSGTAQAGSATTLKLAANASTIDDIYNGSTVRLADGRARVVTDYVGATRVATIGERWPTNLLLHSEAFNNAAWVKNGVSVNPADDIVVNGIKLHKVVGNGNTFTFLWQEFGEVAAGQVVTFSAYTKQGGAARTAIRFFDNQTPTVHAQSQQIEWVDGVPSFGTSSQSSQLTRLAGTIDPVGDGVYRVTLTIRNDTGGPVTLRASMYERWDIAPVAGEFTYWGAAQLELTSELGDYVKTEDSPILLPDSSTDYEVILNDDWTEVATVWAEVAPLSGRELFAAQQIVPEAQYRIRIRYRNDLDETMRITHDGKVYGVQHIAEIGRRDGLEILVRKPE